MKQNSIYEHSDEVIQHAMGIENNGYYVPNTRDYALQTIFRSSQTSIFYALFHMGNISRPVQRYLDNELFDIFKDNLDLFLIHYLSSSVTWI